MDIKPEFDDALAPFRSAAARRPRAAALHYFDATLSYAELDALSNALACALLDQGVKRGDRVAVFLQNVPQFCITELAAWKAGAIFVPLNPMNRERELAALFADCTPRALIAAEAAFADVIGAALIAHPVDIRISTSELDFQNRRDPRLFASTKRQPAPDAQDLVTLVRRHAGEKPPQVRYRSSDTALLVYTSGTTGRPKGAMNTHGNIAFTAQVYRDWIGVRDGAPVLALAPLFHITGLIGHIALSWLVAGPLVLTYRFDAGAMLDAIREYRPEFTVGAITALIALMNHPDAHSGDLKSFRSIYSGGAPIPPSVVDAFEKKFDIYIRNAYGMTETTSPATVTPPHSRSPVDPKFGALSVGVPTFNTEIRIGDENGNPLPAGTEGEILIRGPQVVPGYWNQPDKTREVLHDGWLFSGDIGVMNESGWVFVVDRKKDMINASGYKVWPREVEDVLYTHPAVREAAVVSFPDPYRGESVKAVLSLKPGAAAMEQEIIQFCKERMAAYKYPRRVEFLPELPKTATGKILRRQLRG
ncbi:MAG: class I adenylate-forming enzyme family protein [Rhodanobacteraceae bacterium]